ncbi:hypothetical protein [uncultured Legionella sp.]|uniref:hypothetical protein n=1 Tax=uncultured Legionella sp. TaxID=210934 RepID=UPI00260A47CA|nr:hypothetical protein [uncultured Legionella sp.]
MNAKKDRPEIENIKNICETSPGTKETKDVCDAVNQKKLVKKAKNTPETRQFSEAFC